MFVTSARQGLVVAVHVEGSAVVALAVVIYVGLRAISGCTATNDPVVSNS
jgi:hypothetical protein